MSSSSDEESVDSTHFKYLSQPSTSKDEKRHYHNVLERKRRNTLKDNFMGLMEVIPSLVKKGFSVNGKKASRVSILKHAIHYLKRTERKREGRLQDLRNLKSDLAQLERHYLELQDVERTGDYSNVESIFKSIDAINAKVYEDSTDSEEEIEDIDEEEETESDNEEEEAEEIEFTVDDFLSAASYCSQLPVNVTDSNESSEYFFSGID